LHLSAARYPDFQNLDNLRKEDAMPKGFVSFREVKSAVSLESVLRRYELFAGLREKGANLVGRCPFCESPSAQQFQVSPAKNAWHCFACKAGGNVLDFVAKREGMNVRAAALRLNEWFELGLLAEAPPAAPAPPPPAVPSLIPTPAPSANPPLTFALKTLDPAHPSLARLGLQAATLESFGAGYCSKGLLKGRLAIPIHGGGGEVVAYSGLALDEGTPRYLYPPNFHPALEVMNLHRLSASAKSTKPLYLAPEILGVLRLVQAGFSSVLGLFDGSFSREQEDVIAALRTRFERIVCLGRGFAEGTIARLACHFDVRWLSGTEGTSSEVTDDLSQAVAP
jgi:DNA primase